MAEEFRVLRPREYHKQLISKGQRVDGRKLDELREIKLEIDAIKTADSSSLVKLGSTSLVCGCTSQLMQLGEKSEDVDEIKIRVELPPICSGPSNYKTQNTAQLLTVALKNILNESKCIDNDDLRTPGSNHYWSIDLEVVCLNYDGCLLDASLLAVLSAIKSLVLSSKTIDNANQIIRLRTTPICSTFAIIGDNIICDPNLEEETVAESTFSITIDPATGRSCYISKLGGKSLSRDNLMKCIQLAKQRANSSKQILESLKSEVEMDCST